MFSWFLGVWLWLAYEEGKEESPPESFHLIKGWNGRRHFFKYGVWFAQFVSLEKSRSSPLKVAHKGSPDSSPPFLFQNLF